MPDDRAPSPSPPHVPSPRRVPLGRYLVPVACGFVATVAVVLVVLIGHGAGSAGGGGGSSTGTSTSTSTGAAAGGGVATAGGSGGGSGGGAAGSPAGGSAAAPVPASVGATCVRAPSHDSQGNPTSYEPARAVDDDPTTAWRCDGDGIGQQITVTLAGPARVARVGLVPGLAKTDPGDGTDRYAQNRRLARVRITTDAGSVEATLDTDPNDRSPQYVTLDGATTRSVAVTILDSVPGSTQNGQAAIDSVAISELTLS